MTDKHYVLVPEPAVQPYLAKGYARADTTARAHLGAQWHDAFEADKLVVLEIAAEQHEQLNQNPRRFRVHLYYDHYLTEAHPRVCEVLEAGPYSTIAADLDSDGPNTFYTSELHLTAQEAALEAVEPIRASITKHRQAIEDLEAFLRKHT